MQIREKEMPIIVSGLPRSGTSLMMSMLEAAGYNILIDMVRTADKNNPKGYYEYEPVKRLKYNNSWLLDAKGMVIKVVSPLLTYIPLSQPYKIIFMQRKLSEVIASQNKMMKRSNTSDKNYDENLIKDFELHISNVMKWLNNQTNMYVCYINFNQLLSTPQNTLIKLAEYLNISNKIDVMCSIVDTSLYRERL